jgi:hypothetical protein
MGYTGKKPATSAQIDSSADIVDGVIQSQDIQTLDAAKLTGTVATARLGTGTADSTKFLRGDNTWQVVAVGATQLDLPTITGTLSLLSGGSVTHTITNWSDDLSWTITPTNCTVSTVNASGEFVVTHTSGLPSYTIIATTASLGLADSNTVTKNISLQLTAPTISSPADSSEAINVTYTITSTTADDDKLILNIGSSNFTYQSVSVGTASKVGNTVECVGFTTNNPAVIIQYTAEATYSVTATSAKIDGTFTTSAASSADSITILNPTLAAPTISSPADVGTSTNAAYTITSNDANDNKLILDIGSSNFNFGSVSVGSASKVGNTVECTGFTTNNPVVTIQFTAEATYSVTAKATDTAGYYHDSVNSSADSITIQNYVGMIGTGGTITTSGDYKIHTFNSSDATGFTVTTLGSDGVVEYLVIAGGGGGSGSNGSLNHGGGGAGGYRTATGLSVSATNYPITVGGGGGQATSGGNSIFSSITATGGGRANMGDGAAGQSGGSGGGGTYATSGAGSSGGSGNAGGFSPVEGYAGGTASGAVAPHCAGAGGGASAVGFGNNTGVGGAGRASSITGSSVTRAGGGGGGGNTASGPAGGAGGGGNGGDNGTNPPTSGTVNTGSGGGGASGAFTGGSGGSGVVIIKYRYQQ